MTAPSRAWLLVPAGLSLLGGLDAALLLAEVPAPIDAARLPEIHGVLLVLGFLGTLIALERAVALRRPWAYAAPVLLGAGGLTLLSPLARTAGQLLLVDGCVALIAVYAALWRRNRDDAVIVELLGAVLALCGALLWIRLEVAALLPWLVGFLVLTIAAERVELARITLPRSSGAVLLTLAAALTAAAASALLWPAVGSRAFGLGLLVLVGWLIRHDVARRTIRASGLPRFSAAALLAGYLWLAVSAATWVAVGRPASTAAYDTVVHGAFLGFGMSMVMAHAPVILPAVIRRPLPYRRYLWAPLVVLQLGLVLRIGLGNGASIPPAWTPGAVLTVVALVLLPMTAALSALTARTSGTPGVPARPPRPEPTPHRSLV
jgi:hypothetical protein